MGAKTVKGPLPCKVSASPAALKALVRNVKEPLDSATATKFLLPVSAPGAPGVVGVLGVVGVPGVVGISVPGGVGVLPGGDVGGVEVPVPAPPGQAARL